MKNIYVVIFSFFETKIVVEAIINKENFIQFYEKI